MRDIDECKAEVFRRMDERIKERKRKRNRMIACCVPLCLCLVVFSVTMLPEIVPLCMYDAYAENIATEGSESLACVYTLVEIQDNRQLSQNHESISNTDEIITIYNAIEDLFSGKSTEDLPDMEVVEDFGTMEGTEAESKEDYDFSITFTAIDGSVTTYMLKGAVLLDVNENIEIELTENQLNELKAILGLLE